MEAVALPIGTNLSDGDDGLGQEATRENRLKDAGP